MTYWLKSIMFIDITHLKDGQQGHASDQAAERQGKQHKGGNTACFLPLFTWGLRRNVDALMVKH